MFAQIVIVKEISPRTATYKDTQSENTHSVSLNGINTGLQAEKKKNKKTLCPEAPGISIQLRAKTLTAVDNSLSGTQY